MTAGRLTRTLGSAAAVGLAAGTAVLPLYTRLSFTTAAAGVAILALVAFFLLSENGLADETRIIAVAVMTAAAVAGRAAFYFAPGFKPILAVVILCGACLGCSGGFLCGALSMLLSNFLFGQGPWTPFQMLGAGFAGFTAGLLKPVNRLPVLVVWGVLASYIYGALTDVWTMFSLGEAVSFRAWVAVALAGIPMSTVLAVSTAIFIVLLGAPFKSKLDRLKKRYGIGR